MKGFYTDGEEGKRNDGDCFIQLDNAMTANHKPSLAPPFFPPYSHL